MSRVSFIVELKLPIGATLEEARRYIESAVSNWAGSLEPGRYNIDGEMVSGDSMSNLDTDTVIVRHEDEHFG